MTYDEIAKEIENLFRTLQGIIIAALVYFGAFVVAAVPAVFTGMGVAALFADVTSYSTLIGWLIGIALEVVNIIIIHTASEFYSDKPTGRFWILVGLIPIYVFGVEWVMYYSDDAFPELVRSLGMVSPFFAIAVFIAAMFNQWHKATTTEAEQEKEETTRQRLERERLELEHQHELERLALEQKHAQKMARIEASKNRPGERPKPEGKTVSKEEAISLILQFLAENPDASLSQIGREIGRPKSTTGNYVNELIEAGKIYRNGEGWKVR